MSKLNLIQSMVLFVMAGIPVVNAAEYVPADGDIIFHVSQSRQSLAIQRATNSPYSHLGIVFIEQGTPVVYEAIDPVSSTTLKRWVERGKDGEFVVKRMKEGLAPESAGRLRQTGRTFFGSRYDLYFEWSDDRLYCSEFVWKVYKRGLGVELGKLQTIKEFNLTDPVVQAKIKERWSEGPPLEEIVVSPKAVFDCALLATVHDSERGSKD